MICQPTAQELGELGYIAADKIMMNKKGGA